MTIAPGNKGSVDDSAGVTVAAATKAFELINVTSVQEKTSMHAASVYQVTRTFEAVQHVALHLLLWQFVEEGCRVCWVS